MKSTYLEKFARIYKYPYGNSFLQDPVQNTHECEEFERFIQKKRTYKPFHLECKLTKKKLCYCDNGNASYGYSKSQNQESQRQYQDIVNDLQNHFDGYPSDIEEKMKRKLSLEKERLMNIQSKEYGETFEKYLEYLDEDEIQKAFDTQVKPSRKECTYCKTTLYDNQTASTYKDLGDQVQLCQKCQQNLISGMIDPGSENKKVARYIQSSVTNQTKLKTPSQKPALPTKPAITKSKVSSKPKAPSNSAKEPKEESKASSDSCVVCQKLITSSELINSVKCSICKKSYHSQCHQPPLNCDLVKRFPWECPDCKACKKCQLNTDEDKIIICDMCDKAMHIHCLEPALPQIPSNNWFCKDCIECALCKKQLENIQTKGQGFWFENRRVCKDCQKVVEEGNFCRICMQVNKEDEEEEEEYVQCDDCQFWVHIECCGIPKDKLSDKDPYICPNCKSKKGKGQAKSKK